MCAYHHPDHCACTSNSLPCALSAFCLYPAPFCLWALPGLLLAAKLLTPCSHHGTLSLFPWEGFVLPIAWCKKNRAKEEQRLKKNRDQALSSSKPAALPAGTPVQEIPLLEHRLFADTVEGKKEKAQERAGLDHRFLSLAAFFSIDRKWGGGSVKVTAALPGDQAASCPGDTHNKSSLSYLGPKGEVSSRNFCCKQNTFYHNCATPHSEMNPWNNTRNVKMKVIICFTEAKLIESSFAF